MKLSGSEYSLQKSLIKGWVWTRSCPVAFGLVMGLTLLLQGCVAVAWLCAVGVGNSVNGSVKFHPFQNSWVAPVSHRTEGGPMQSIAVVPFEGDKDMAHHFKTIFQEQSTLLVKDVEGKPSDLVPNPSIPLPPLLDFDQSQKRQLAKDIAQQHAVDCVLFGRIQQEGSAEKDNPTRPPITNRLFLELVNAEGALIWKDELPYSLNSDPQPIADEWFNETLSTHVITHTKQLGLTELHFHDNMIVSLQQ